MLSIYIDFKSPASYLAMQPIMRLREKYPSLIIDWHSFSTFERQVPTVTKDPELAVKHAQVRAASIKALHQKYATHQELELNFPPNLTSADLALGALTLIEAGKEKFIEAAYEAYWGHHANLDDVQVVHAVLRRVAESTSLPTEQNLRDAFDAAQKKAEEIDVVQAPAFHIAGQLFIGREHLPWIEEIIQAELKE